MPSNEHGHLDPKVGPVHLSLLAKLASGKLWEREKPRHPSRKEMQLFNLYFCENILGPPSHAAFLPMEFASARPDVSAARHCHPRNV
jgi:hypothetical protein